MSSEKRKIGSGAPWPGSRPQEDTKISQVLLSATVQPGDLDAFDGVHHSDRQDLCTYTAEVGAELHNRTSARRGEGARRSGWHHMEPGIGLFITSLQHQTAQSSPRSARAHASFRSFSSYASLFRRYSISASYVITNPQTIARQQRMCS